ncbi:hypothetical protein E2C01_088212 [Portunus trituberculatus]|uniref:Uncharacterized protein n=1 Tax=Portunus trituberculatus TaxID=210409 RepID=A0A5B7JFC7_PORTR|nr:hypothetical protein [Portunus trituberculatus]
MASLMILSELILSVSSLSVVVSSIKCLGVCMYVYVYYLFVCLYGSRHQLRV